MSLYISEQVGKYHMSIQWWAAQVVVTVSGKEVKAILKKYFINVIILFNYPESENEMKMYLHHYQSYYNSVKKDIKSDHACEIIEEVAISIERNMKYLCHYHFIDVTTFDFVGDSIAEAKNCGLKGVMLLFLKIRALIHQRLLKFRFPNHRLEKAQICPVLLIYKLWCNIYSHCIFILYFIT